MKFDDETIERLFGNEAADYENIERLTEYYFKSKIYDRVTANLPLRILVGHKGIGKSALFKFSMNEDHKQGILPIFIKPDDVANIALENQDFLTRIQEWKKGLYQTIGKKVLDEFGIGDNPILQTISNPAGKFFNLLLDSIAGLVSKSGLDDAPVKKAVASKFLENKQIRIYLDDLDRGWAAKKNEINRISALLSAILDICNEYKNIQFRIALRSDVYYLYRTSDESTDKTESSVIWYGWTNHEILIVLVKRIETFFGRNVDDEKLMKLKQSDLAKYLDSVIENKFTGGGKWENAPTYRILMSLIRRRPRDLVKLCTLAARKANEQHSLKITSDNFKEIFEEYSQGRAQDTYNEYRSELPQIQRLIQGMRPTQKEARDGNGWVYSTDQLLKKIGKIIEQGKFTNSSGSPMGAKELAQFLYKINFLTARKDISSGSSAADSLIDRKYFEENRYLSSEFADFGYSWEIHPAFRWHLQPEKIKDIFQQLALSQDD